MAGLADQNGHDALEEKLGRLSSKPGVRASIILDRASGAILKTSGQSSALRTAKARDAASAASLSNEVPAAEASEAQGVDDFAAMIWNYVSVSSQLVQEADKEDELRLLRLRTKKQEIVIVPDAKYVLAVIHDTPTA
ncbi:Dynein light chain-related protein [Moelleriella libera RCEF 2490]|uniref:Dynein light chain-related protein n=1 Tax=Moelleriella libera RCEF 2490 TaxID=1081109 RepID=A0A167ZYM7_9HYPO|nr:Dynein light chain-related protein [Moelleriella libera RCEF 2490]